MVRRFSRRVRVPAGALRAVRRVRKVNRMLRRRNVRSGGLLGKELKYLDTQSVLVASPVTAAISTSTQDPSATTVFNSIAQGDGKGDRDGRQCIVKSLEIRGKIEHVEFKAQDQAGIPVTGRIVIFQDKQTNAAMPTLTQLFIPPTPLSVHQPYALRNLEYQKRFKILKDVMFQVKPQASVNNAAITTVSTVFDKFKFHYTIPMSMVTNFTGTDGTISTIVDNSLHMMIVADTASRLTCMYQSRVRFIG